VIAVSFGANDGTAMRRRLESAFERFRRRLRNTDVEIATQLRQSEVDIAVDLMGFTGDCRRAFSRGVTPGAGELSRLCRVDGAPYIDYIIADRTLIPEDQRIYYDEQVVYLPHSYLPMIALAGSRSEHQPRRSRPA